MQLYSVISVFPECNKFRWNFVITIKLYLLYALVFRKEMWLSARLMKLVPLEMSYNNRLNIQHCNVLMELS